MNKIDMHIDDVEESEENEEFSLKVTKKNKKKKDISEQKQDSISNKDVSNDTEDYTYLELLNRVYTIINEQNIKTGNDKIKKIIPVPKLARVGTKKISWLNFTDTAQVLGRTVGHLMIFFLSELGTEGNLDGNKYFIMKGRYTVSQIESLLKKYIMEYVKCGVCNSMETSIIRDQSTRLYFIKCEKCMSSRSISIIKSRLKNNQHNKDQL